MQVVFIIVSFITLGSGIMVVTVRNLFHAALYMMLSFLGVAGLYVLLESGFMAATQLLVYIGAISILVIFAIMMTRRLMQTTESPFNTQWVWGGLASLFVAALLILLIIQAPFPLDTVTTAPPYSDPAVAEAIDNNVVTLGKAFVDADQYILPFELASVLLLVALVGSIIIARPDVEDES